MGDAFDSWLTVRLKEVEADEVFCPYIRSILDGDESAEDKTASLEDMLAGLGLENAQELQDQILYQWTLTQNCEGAASVVVPRTTGAGVDLSAALASITDTRDKEYAAAKALSAAKGGAAADKDVKAAIMAQYSQVAEIGSEEEESEDEEELGEGRNANKETVAAAERELRESNKAQAEAKKCKDKEDREKQKKTAEEKKKKAQEKVQKVERKR